MLCDGYDDENACWYGRSYADSPDIDGRVSFTSRTPVRVGDFVTVRIEGARDGDLYGEVEA